MERIYNADPFQSHPSMPAVRYLIDQFTRRHMQPSEILFENERRPIVLPVCDHYAGSEKLMRKSMALQQELGPAFDITLDCEDGAAVGNEEAQAKLVGRMLNSEENCFNRIGARVHDITHPAFEQDIQIICTAAAKRLAYLVIPKVNNVQEVQHAVQTINRYAIDAGRTTLPIHVLIETHGALADVHAIAALDQVECLSFGIMDFVSAHYGAIPGTDMRSPGQFTHPLIARAKLEIAAACHAHGKVPSHNVTMEIRDPSVVESDARQARMEFGYTRMWSIHPSQIKAIVGAFMPAHAEIDKAARILLAAQEINWAPIQLDGELHDRASYRYYWTVIDRARLSGLPLSDSIKALC